MAQILYHLEVFLLAFGVFLVFDLDWVQCLGLFLAVRGILIAIDFSVRGFE